MKKLMILVLSLVLILVPMTATAEVGGTTTPVFSDIPSDWSTEALQNAIENGLLTGFDGKIMPKDNLTRAQMATIINRAFGSTEKASLEMFSDINIGDWFYDEMAKAVQMKTFKGEGSKLNPNTPITRTEAFVVIARALKLENSSVAPTGFNDLASIPEWAKGELYALINAEYIAGSNGYINPLNNISRAEFAKVMDNIFKAYIKEAGEYTEVESGNLVVNVPGVTLKDLTISGDLIVADGVGHGDLILDNVNISGRMVVRGGGVNSIIIRGESKIGSLIIARVDGAVRILAEDGAIVDAIYVDDGEDQVIITGTIGQLEIATDVPVVLVNASIDSVTVSAANAQLTVNEDSKVEDLLVSQVSEGAKISVEGSVASVNVEAPKATIEGNGEVKEVLVTSTSNDTSITTPSTKVTTEEGATNVTGTGGVVIPEGTTANNDKDTSKPAVVEEPKAEEKPATGGSSGGSGGSGGGSGGGGSTKPTLKLTGASLNSNPVDIGNGEDFTVNINQFDDLGNVVAVFSNPVKIKGVTTSGGTGGTINLDDLVANSKYLLTGEDSKTLTLPIGSFVRAEHLSVFGNVVTVTVQDNYSQSLVVTITLQGPK